MCLLGAILRRPAERLSRKVELRANSVRQLVGKNSQVRRLPNEPLVLRQLHVADLAGGPVFLLSRRAKHLASDEPLAGIQLADHVVRPRLSAPDLLSVEKPGQLDRALPLAGNHLGSPHDPCRSFGIDLGTFLDRAFVGDHEVSAGVFHLHESIPDAGRLDVVAAAKGIIHAPLHLGPQLRDERLVHRTKHRKEQGRLRVGAVESVAGTDNTHPGFVG